MTPDEMHDSIVSSMQAKSLTQVGLAEKLGVNQATISRALSRRSPEKLREIYALLHGGEANHDVPIDLFILAS